MVLAHSLGGLRHPKLAALVKADRAVAEKLPVLDRLLTPEFRAQQPGLACLSGRWARSTRPRWLTWAATAPALEELDAAPFPLLLAGEKDAVLSPGTVRRAGELLPGPGWRSCPARNHSWPAQKDS